MLNWWLGKAADPDANHEDEVDPPDTPAPVFAARAFKSAIFGTPKPPEFDELESLNIPKDIAGEHRRVNSTTSMLSPTKPQGILLTPGTITRRKTVSFGATVIDNEIKNGIGKSGIPSDCPGKFPSPWTPKMDSNFQPTRRTALTRTLENARDGNSKRTKPDKGVAHGTSQSVEDRDFEPSKSDKCENADDVQDGEKLCRRPRSSSADSFDGDMTLDLNEPHSQSGKYWKSEYERYHEEAKAQMRKLVKYKQLAKSYAKKKDGEAIDLGEKLKEEQQKVKSMEDKISELVAQIAERRITGNEDDSPELMKDLARQTALAVQYRDQVDQFEAAMRERNDDLDLHSGSDGQKSVSPKTEKTLVETSYELKKARKKLQEMASLRAEMHSLRLNLSAAERRAARLQEENSKLARELAKANAELDKSEKRRQSADALNQKRDELLVGLHRDYDHLKEKAKSQRQEAETLLKKRHDQVSGLRKELVALKGQSITNNAKPSVPESEDRGNAMAMVANLVTEDLISMETPPKAKLHDISSKGMLNRQNVENLGRGNGVRDNKAQIEQPNMQYRENADLVGSKIPVLDESNIRSRNSRTDSALTSSAVPRGSSYKPRRSCPALSEIINDANVENSPRAPAAPLTMSFHERFSNLSLESPNNILPSPEPSLVSRPSRAVHDKYPLSDQRSTAFRINNELSQKSRLKPEVSGKENSGQRSMNISQSRLSSLSSNKARSTLPPERAAAAKARLEQRNAVKKLSQHVDRQKENIGT